MPENYWDPEKNEFKSSELAANLSDFQQMKADADARAAATPKTADGYKVELPADFTLPEGYVIDEKNPLIGALREAALETGLPQDAFAKVLAKGAAAMAAQDIAQHAAIKAATDKRDQQLGAKAAERVTALHDFFKTIAPDPKVQEQLKATLWTPDIVRVFEDYAALKASQGTHSFTQTGRDNTVPDGKPDNWAGMSPVDRRTWQLANQRAAGGNR